MSKPTLDNYIKGYSSRCVCCDKVLSDRTYSLNKVTGEMDPYCSYCRYIIKSSAENIKVDNHSLEQEVWREPLGTVTPQQFSDVESTYQGYN